MTEIWTLSLRQLASWFEDTKRLLPWREDPTPYRVWVSEIMLQQTQVATVIGYFDRFMKRFPDIQSLAQASESEVLLLWAGLGYYRRAKHLHRASQEVVKAGTFPESRQEWLKLPGVGEYTAGAILSIAYGKPEPLLDANVERVLARLRCVGREQGETFYKKRLWRLAKFFVEKGHALGIPPSCLNQALMELGASLCSVSQPECLICPLNRLCRSFKRGQQTDYPTKKSPKVWIAVQETVHCIFRGDEVLVRQRESPQWRAGLWDFLVEKPVWTSLRYLAEVKTQHVVTRHKIQRRTHIWKLSKKASVLCDRKVEKWIACNDSTLPTGAAFKKSLQAVTRFLSS